MDSLTHSNQFQTENESYSDHQYVSDIPLCSLPWSPVPGLSANHEKNINYDYFINYKQTIASNWNGKYVLIFARGHYLFQEANYGLRRTDTVQGQNIQAYFCTK